MSKCHRSGWPAYETQQSAVDIHTIIHARVNLYERGGPSSREVNEHREIDRSINSQSINQKHSTRTQKLTGTRAASLVYCTRPETKNNEKSNKLTCEFHCSN